MTAIAAAERGQKVLLIEKMDQAGRKLRITGKGHCNLTNTAVLKDYLPHIGSDCRFLRNCFSRFFNQELMDFFEQRGVPLVEERGGRVFPKSGKSLDIFLALINDLEKRDNVTIRKNCAVKSLVLNDILANDTPQGDTRHVLGVKLQNGEFVPGRKVVVATGGLSYPTTGSTGIGFRFATECGHTVISQVPSLVPLICTEKIPKELVGFVLKNVTLNIQEESGRKICDFFGEMTFTEDGIGGPIVLSASRVVSRRIQTGEHLKASIDLKPALSEETLDKRLINDLNANGTRIFNDALRLWLPAEVIPFALKQMHIEYYKRLHQINAAERRRLLHFLKGMTLTLVGTRSYNEAIVTQGGVSLKEINPKTMESKLVSGLHFVREVLDLDADTGGYNLQIAFSTGYAAGMAE